MADLTIIKQKLKDYTDTLKNISYDKNNDKYMCNSEIEVFNFDSYKEKTKTYKNKKSFDGLYLNLNDNEVYCLEFKNQETCNINNKDIQGKYKDGIEILVDLLRNNNINIKEYKFYFFVIFSNSSEKFIQYRRMSLKNETFFGLEGERIELGETIDIHKKIIIRTHSVGWFSKKFKKILSNTCSL